MDNIKKDSFSHQVLMYLKDTSKDLLDAGIMMVFEPRKLIRQYGVSLYGNHNNDYFSRKLYNIKRSSYFVVKDNKCYVSRKGRIEIIQSLIEDKKKVKKWDGKWRAIIFDVPEKNKRERNFLRRELKSIGFKELQHSIWITPYDIEKELLCLLKFWQEDFSGDIRLLVVEKMTNDEDFKELFLSQK